MFISGLLAVLTEGHQNQGQYKRYDNAPIGHNGMVSLGTVVNRGAAHQALDMLY